ncbi:hypothetical protein OHAE_1008 [Ochrobactrum soli]|uniref:Uncharacterized protein n=1 Tax=Ochrobactrum soli TaxID=2448455 RepID=A0A2P9HM13_9HYPH|nr:hypothetical protein OHAE_1008 [[Ochrobactrum] soli]
MTFLVTGKTLDTRIQSISSKCARHFCWQRNATKKSDAYNSRHHQE